MPLFEIKTADELVAGANNRQSMQIFDGHSEHRSKGLRRTEADRYGKTPTHPEGGMKDTIVIGKGYHRHHRARTMTAAGMKRELANAAVRLKFGSHVAHEHLGHRAIADEAAAIEEQAA